MKIDRKYLPSKNLYKIILPVLIIFIIGIFLYQKKYNGNNKNVLILGDISSTIWSETTIDSDNDGLEDWKEKLYGTNINNADTDGDQTNDSQEIKDGRDPLKANTSQDPQKPNDLMEKTTIEKYKNIIEENSVISYRDILNNKINSQIEKESQINNDITSIITKAVIENVPTIQYTATTKISDLFLVEANKENIISYIKFYALESENISLFFEKDIDILTTDKINTEDFNKLIKLLSSIKNNFQKAHLPKDSEWGLKYHLEIIQNLEKMSLAISDIKKSKNNDPLLYYSSLEAYNNTRSDLTSILIVLDEIFNVPR